MSEYLTVNQFAERHGAFTRGGLRSLIFDEHKNGLAEMGVIVRIGRKVLINSEKFFIWLESGQQQTTKKALHVGGGE